LLFANLCAFVSLCPIAIAASSQALTDTPESHPYTDDFELAFRECKPKRAEKYDDRFERDVSSLDNLILGAACPVDFSLPKSTGQAAPSISLSRSIGSIQRGSEEVSKCTRNS